MAASDKHIGHASCPLCNSKSARLGLSAKGYAYLTCNACNSQVFARSDRSDEALRARHIPDAATPPPAAAKAAPAPATAAPAAPPPAPAPARKPMAWGILGQP